MALTELYLLEQLQTFYLLSELSWANQERVCAFVVVVGKSSWLLVEVKS